MSRLSLRWRLTLWYGLALVVLMVLTGSIVYLTQSHRLMARTDQELDEELGELALEVQLARDLNDVQHQLSQRFGGLETFDFQVLAADGRPIFRSERLQGYPLTPPPSLLDHNSRNVNERHPTLGELRVASRLVPAFGQQLVLQVAARLTNDRRELADLLQLMLILGPVGLLMALSIGYLLVWKALDPVLKMTVVAERISGAQLAERVPAVQQNDELGRLSQTFNRMLDRVQFAVEELQRFTADAAHELRTPLAILQNEVEVALKSSRSPEEYERTLSVMLDEIQRLARLTNQLLLLSRQDAGLVVTQRELVDLVPLLQGACDQLAPLASERRVSLKFHDAEPATVLGDELLLFQLIFNLIENGIKYTPGGGEVRIEAQREPAQVELRIADTGVGIPAEHLPNICRRFYRVDASRNREAGGTGLGLAICESIVRTHGGTIEIASQVGWGTCVTVRLPLARQTTASAVATL